MLRAYGPGCDGSIIEAKAEKIPDGATWIDLEEPTDEEEQLVERCVGLNVPTQEEMAEIEPSSRLYERDGALYMTISALCGVADGDPTTHADRLRPRRQPAGHRPLRHAQAGPRCSWSMCGASRNWRATRRPCWCECSTRSSTGSPTSSRGSAPSSSGFQRTSSSASSRIGESRRPA